jgi:hypothetical protein
MKSGQEHLPPRQSVRSRVPLGAATASQARGRARNNESKAAPCATPDRQIPRAAEADSLSTACAGLLFGGPDLVLSGWADPRILTEDSHRRAWGGRDGPRICRINTNQTAERRSYLRRRRPREAVVPGSLEERSRTGANGMAPDEHACDEPKPQGCVGALREHLSALIDTELRTRWIRISVDGCGSVFRARDAQARGGGNTYLR